MIIISIAINAIVVLAQSGVQTQTTMGEFDADMFHVTIEKHKDEEDEDIKFKIVRKNKNNEKLFTNFVLAKSATTTFYDASTSKFAPEGNDFTYAFNRLASKCPNQGGKNEFGKKDTAEIQAYWKFGVVKTWPSEWRYIYIIRGKGVKLTKSDCSKFSDYEVQGPSHIAGFVYKGVYSKSLTSTQQIGSGKLIEPTIIFKLLDYYGQTVKSEDRIAMKFSPKLTISYGKSWIPPSDLRIDIDENNTIASVESIDAYFTGVFETIVNGGSASFNHLGIMATPGMTFIAEITAEKVSYIPVTVEVTIKNCTGGQKWTLNSGCVQCESGKYTNKTNAFECLSCPKGKVSNTGICIKCEAGKFQDDIEQSSCKPCLAGSYSLRGAHSCINCAPGRYGSEPGLIECEDCDAGTASKEGSPTCTDCGKGTYSLKRQAVCSTCLPGKYQDDAKQSECKACKAGYYNDGDTDENGVVDENDPGLAFCKSCPAGKKSSTFGATTCLACKLGMFASTPRTKECVQCGVGTTSALNRESCQSCPSGQFSGDSDLGCKQCQRGTYNNAAAKASCDQCPPGSFSNANGSTTCTNCEKYSWTNGEKGRHVCTPCKVGEVYPSENTGGACDACPLGRYSLIAGEPYFGCHGCPVGAECPGGKLSMSTADAQLLIKKGWWATSGEKGTRPEGTECGSAVKLPPQCNSEHDLCEKNDDGCICKQQEEAFGQFYDKCGIIRDIYPCKFPDACVGAQINQNGTWDNLCNVELGYAGILCETCDDENGWFMTKKGCRNCEKEVAGSISILITMILLLVLLFAVLRWLAKNVEYLMAFKTFTRTTKVMADFLQITGTVGSVYSITLPNVLLEFLASLDFVSFDWVTIFAVPCVGKMNFYTNYLLSISLPISVIALLIVIRFYHGCRSELARQKHLKESHGGDVDGDGVINSDDFMQLIQSAKREEAKHTKRKNSYTKLIYFMLLFLYMPIAVNTFQFFQCRKIEGVWYLVNDYRYKCYDGMWFAYGVVAMIIIVIFIFGFPLYMARALNSVKDKLDTKKVKASHGYMFLAYNHNAYFWEVTLLLRKLLLSAAPIMLYGQANIQVSFSAILCTIFHVFHGVYNPFEHNFVNYIQHFALFATTCTFVLLPLAEATERNSVENSRSIGLLIIGINVTLCVGGALSILVSFLKGCFAAKKIHMRNKVGLNKNAGEKINAWRTKSKANVKIVPADGLSLVEVRKTYGASSKEYHDALEKYSKEDR